MATLTPPPTVGRLVHYHVCDKGQPLAALIVHVSQWPWEGVSLRTYSPLGPECDLHVEGVQFSCEGPKAGCWTWPPRS